jgi:hypothetical protein
MKQKSTDFALMVAVGVGMVQQTVKFGGGGVIMWGCMTPSGLGMMCRIEGRMDQYMYRDILERELMHKLHASCQFNFST